MQDGTFLKHGHVEVTEAPEPSQPFEVNQDCALVSDLLSRIGDKWSILVVALLGNGKMRFSKLRREVGTISQKMLTTTLRNLERDGFVERTVYPTIPPKVEYELTELGRDLLCPVSALGRWAKANAEQVQTARERFDAEKDKN
ncbi:winged helix-turn-helix transcriptional regulator [Mariluticola halotolerans]|uniref:winged helix-turn-helix transcriptional regulator n=1 Tax=Mariluticola halotolerans TaxID=2909283 RepID=UPI0026E32AF6|nr:helix-turn-helix domain-containing protein [Mariluticola halotolerans]UJQ95514.1 helix-turn-helix transcriptional regulator [Mariluticola halotolerans]